jgi:hypothetical protein
MYDTRRDLDKARLANGCKGLNNVVSLVNGLEVHKARDSSIRVLKDAGVLLLLCSKIPKFQDSMCRV